MAQAQSFDRVAKDYDRLTELNASDLLGPCIGRLLPAGVGAAGSRALDLGCGTGRHAVRLAQRFAHVDAVDLSGPMIELAQMRHPQPNITYRQADLLDVDVAGRYSFVLSVLTLHHVPDLHGALSHIKTLVAPGGRLVVIDMYSVDAASASERLHRAFELAVPLRLRLHGLFLLTLGVNIVSRGPAVAWEIYRLSTRRAWLDHRVTDRFFSRRELESSCQALFPGHRLDVLGGPRGVVLSWDAPRSCGPAGSLN
jgi:ubiquinone/menaquinone biosynthesis C-methylase UbiE